MSEKKEEKLEAVQEQNQQIQECNEALLRAQREVGRLEQKLNAGALNLQL